MYLNGSVCYGADLSLVLGSVGCAHEQMLACTHVWLQRQDWGKRLVLVLVLVKTQLVAPRCS